jgi:hypothetical protein
MARIENKQLRRGRLASVDSKGRVLQVQKINELRLPQALCPEFQDQG